MLTLDAAKVAVGVGYGLGGGAGFAVVTAFLRWVAIFIAGRIDKQQARVDTGMQALVAGLKERLDEEKESRLAEIARREKVEAELHAELRVMREALHECERKHAESEARVKRLEAVQLGFGDANAKAQQIIAADKISRRSRSEG